MIAIITITIVVIFVQIRTLGAIFGIITTAVTTVSFLSSSPPSQTFPLSVLPLIIAVSRPAVLRQGTAAGNPIPRCRL